VTLFASPAGPMQRRVAIGMGLIDIQSGIDQDLHYVGPSLKRSSMGRCVPRFLGNGRIRPHLQQMLHNIDLPPQHGCHQTRLSRPLMLGIQIGSLHTYIHTNIHTYITHTDTHMLYIILYSNLQSSNKVTVNYIRSYLL